MVSLIGLILTGLELLGAPSAIQHLSFEYKVNFNDGT